MFPYLERLQRDFTATAPPHPQIDALARSPLRDIPHVLLCGPHGSLAPYYVRALIDRVACPKGCASAPFAGMATPAQPRPFVQSIPLPNNDSVSFTLFSAPHYIECQPSTLSIYDKHVISGVIKPIGSQASLFYDRHVLFIRDIDELSESAQFCLRRMLELYSHTMWFVFTACSATRLCEPLRSRVLYVRFGLPSLGDLNHLARAWTGQPELDVAPLVAVTGAHVTHVAMALPEWLATGAYAPPEHEALIHTQLESLRKARTPWSVNEIAQEMAHMWSYYHVPMPVFLRSVLSYVTVTFKKKQAVIIAAVERLAEADHVLQLSRREHYPLVSLLADLHMIMWGSDTARKAGNPTRR